MDIQIIEQSVEAMQCDALVVGVASKKIGHKTKELILA